MAGALAPGGKTGQSVVMGPDRLTRFNELPTPAARRALLECCSAPRWAEMMAAARPYGRARDAIRQSDAIIGDLVDAEVADALAGHPRIGERAASLADWSRREQAGVDADDAQITRALADANAEYERRFGHIYLVCASGRAGSELLALLRDRLDNEPEEEWQIVRTELQKINALRLERLLADSA
jgi:2-oxo-4-hydroxy-4-carboxy-5-ureidoimidazoline decarboxylase